MPTPTAPRPRSSSPPRSGYCGCQQIVAIGELTDEHERLRNLGAELTAAAQHADLRSAIRLARQMLDIPAPHTEVEERGLFPAMVDEFGPHLARLVGEHREIDAALAAVATTAHAGSSPANWPAQACAAVEQLSEHILKEQDGVFPAALATLSSADWDAVTAVRGA